jgi:hypothetical protein
LVNAYDFYSDRKSEIMGLWPFWIGIVCLMISLGAIYIWKLIIFAVLKNNTDENIIFEYKHQSVFHLIIC